MSSVNATSGSYGLPDWLSQPSTSSAHSANSFSGLQDFGTIPNNVATFATRSVDSLVHTTGAFDPYRNLFLSVVEDPMQMSELTEGKAIKNALRRLDRYVPNSVEGFSHLYSKAERYIPALSHVAPDVRERGWNLVNNSQTSREWFAKLAKRFKFCQEMYNIADDAVTHGPEFYEKLQSAAEKAKASGNYNPFKDALGKLSVNDAKSINIEHHLLNMAKPQELIDIASKHGKGAALQELFNVNRMGSQLNSQWAAASGKNAFAKAGDILTRLHVNEVQKIITPFKNGKILEGCARSMGWGLLAFSWAKNTVNAYRASRIKGESIGKALWKGAKMFMGQGVKLLTCWQTFNIGFEIGAGLAAICGVTAGLPVILASIVGGAIVSAGTHAIMSKFFPDAPKIVK